MHLSGVSAKFPGPQAHEDRSALATAPVGQGSQLRELTWADTKLAGQLAHELKLPKGVWATATSLPVGPVGKHNTKRGVANECGRNSGRRLGAYMPRRR